MLKMDYDCFRSCMPSRFTDSRPISPTVLDTLNPREHVAVASSFFFSVAILCIIGGLGPPINQPTSIIHSAPCSKLTPCAATVAHSFGPLSQLNQATWLTAVMQRPVDIYGVPLAMARPVTFYLSWTVNSVTLNGAPLAASANSTRTAQVVCPPAQTDCSPVFLFGRVLYEPSDFALSVTFQDPLAAFRSEPGLSDGVRFEFRQGNVDARYTNFEVATKVFFCVASMLIWLYFLYCLLRRNHANTLSPTQLWVALLGGLVFWFSDPLFLTFLVRPSVEVAAFSAFCSASYVSLLLFFWLCLADNARLEAELGARWRLDGTARQLGALYWTPKVLLCGVVWVLSISLYVFQRLSQLEDPTFTFSDTFGAAAVMWAQRFAVAFGVLYLLYFVVLLVLAFRRFMALLPSTRYLLAMSVAAIIVTFVGLFSQAFSALRSTSILFLVAQGGPTLYIWNLMFVLRPTTNIPSDWTADTTGVMGNTDHGRDVGVVIREAQEDFGAGALSKEVRSLLPLPFPPFSPPPHTHSSLTRTPLFHHNPRTGSSAPRRSSGRLLAHCSRGSSSAAAACCSSSREGWAPRRPLLGERRVRRFRAQRRRAHPALRCRWSWRRTRPPPHPLAALAARSRGRSAPPHVLQQSDACAKNFFPPLFVSSRVSKRGGRC